MTKTAAAAETRGSLNSGSITRSLSADSCDNGDNAGRNSCDKMDSANTNQRKIPNYLRASTGSCHDICKYGRRHAFEDNKPKIPLRKRIAKPSLNEDAFIEILVSGEQKKENVDSKKPPPDAKAHPPRPNASSSVKAHMPNSTTEKPPSSETPETIVSEGLLPQDSIDYKISNSDHKAFDQLLKHPSSVKSKPVKAKSSDVQLGGKVRALASAKKSAAAPLVPKSSLGKAASKKARQPGRVKSSSPGKDQHRIETEASNNEVPEKTLHVIKIETGNDPLESAPESVSLSQENPPVAEEVNGTDDFASEDKSLIMETENTLLESTLDTFITPALPLPSSLKSSSHRRSPSSSSSSSKSSFHRRTPSSSSSSSKSSSHRRTPSSSSSSSSKSSSHRRSPSLSSSKSSSHSRSPSMSSLEVDEEIKKIVKETDKLSSGKRTTVKISKETLPPKGNLNKNVRKIKVVSCDDKYNRPVKLKFRSGKVLDPPQDNNNNINNIPIRLKFRRMRSDGNKAEFSVSSSKKSLETGNIQEFGKTLRKSRVVVSEYKRRSPMNNPMRLFGSEKKSSLQADNNVPLRLRFRRGRVIGADEGKGDSKRSIRNGGFEGANVKMKLKHQDLKGKKSDQCLFNNVIEETATKLVESRKSKVLALVGAFETVISLHSPRA